MLMGKDDKLDKNEEDGFSIDDIKEGANDKKYSPFHPELDEKYPIDDLLSAKNRELIVSGQMTPMGWVVVFSNSPTKNSEAEVLMGQIVTAAVSAGQWVDIPVRGDEKLGEKIELPDGTKVDFSNVKLEYTKAGEILAENEMVDQVLDDDGGKWLAPKEKLLEFLRERLKPYGPKEE